MKRSSKLFDLIRSWFGRQEAAQASARRLPPSVADLSARLASETDRRAQVVTCREMYATDPRAEGIIRALARDIIGAGFSVRCEGYGTSEARALAEALIKRLYLGSRLDDWLRLTFRDGDSFLELALSEDDKELGSISRKPTLEMRRNSNEQDTFDDPSRAYWWAEDLWLSTEPPKDSVWFADWQIVHARWSHDEGSRYGHPLFSSAISAWRRITEGERDVAVRRKSRAGLRWIHRFPAGTDPTEIEAYKELNTDALDDPFLAIADFFGTVDIQAVQGDATLNEIEDILHHIRTFWLSSPVPMSLLGYGQDLNRDVLDKQREEYEASLLPIRAWAADQFIKPIVELEWLLHGIWPGNLRYEVTWQRGQTLDPQALQQLAIATYRLGEAGVARSTLTDLLRLWLPGVVVTLNSPPAAAPVTNEAENEP